MNSLNQQKELAFNELTGLAHYLVRDGLLNIKQAKLACKKASEQKISFIHYLVKFNILSNQFILDYCNKKFSIPIFDSRNLDYDKIKLLIKPELIYRYRVLPIKIEQNTLSLGINDPTDHETIAAIGFHTGLRIEPLLVADENIEKIINLVSHPQLLGEKLESALAHVDIIEKNKLLLNDAEQQEEPIIQFVDRLLRDAIANQVSDIHIEPYQQFCRIRFRRDGLLTEATSIPNHLAQRVNTRLKVMANLNIAERRLPQDGRIQIQDKLSSTTKIDFRLSTCPILYGEKIVLRILHAHQHSQIDELGMLDEQKKILLDHLALPQGLIIVTGPTGSGKTMTLYSALNYLNYIEKNISTAEDPIEIELMGINQVNVNQKIGWDFPSILRTLLRQDPDILMIGEIRDVETATIALQAAQTGHLVLTTLHTNNAVDAINRLRSLGAFNYHLDNVVSLIIAQKLVRKLCNCKEPDHSPNSFNEKINTYLLGTIYKPKGCENCYHGYLGRSGIFELIPITEKLSHLISLKDYTSILRQGKKQTCTSLWQTALIKVQQGITSIAEIIRVLGNKIEC